MNSGHGRGGVRGTQLSLQAPDVNTTPGPEYAPSTRAWQGIPTIERTPHGRLWAAWYSGGDGEGPDSYVLLVTSGDDGKSWSMPKVVIDPPGGVRAFDPCLWHDPDGRLWLFWAQSLGLFDGRAGVWAITAEDSEAETALWSPPRRLCNGVMLNKPTVLSTGDWCLPAALWQWPPIEPA
jgi:predicted neuraminidase